jgi:hypothetical protein
MATQVRGAQKLKDADAVRKRAKDILNRLRIGSL